MYLSLSANFLLPAIFLNPVLFLHGLNTILSRLLPPIVTAASMQPAPYSMLGPSANNPHIDLHSSDNLCWGYTAVLVCAQLFAYDGINRRREQLKERKKNKKTEKAAAIQQEEIKPWKEANGNYIAANGNSMREKKPEQPRITRPLAQDRLSR